MSFGAENLLNAEYTPVINQAYNASFAYSRGPGMRVFANYSISF